MVNLRRMVWLGVLDRPVGLFTLRVDILRHTHLALNISEQIALCSTSSHTASFDEKHHVLDLRLSHFIPFFSGTESLMFRATTPR